MVFNRRYLQIIIYFGRLALNVIFYEIILRKLGLGALSNQTAPDRYRSASRKFRDLALNMGGVMIKVGQFLSSRIDVLPEYVTCELNSLQDEVPAEKFEPIKATIESEFGRLLAELFMEFQVEPIAAASLGQVHRAKLFSGENIVVKIQRPNIKRLVEIDLAALKTVVRWLKHWKVISRRVDIESLYEEFSKILWEELDYLAEADNARKFAQIFANDNNIRIPEVFPSLTSRHVLTLEDVWFIKITDYDAITAAGVDRQEVAERLFNCYLHQIFKEYFFHADPHPGNLFVEPPGDDHDWRLVFVDFGMVGQITPQIREAGKEAVLAVIKRDPVLLANSSVLGGVLLPGTDIELLTSAYTKVFDRFWGMSMEELKEMNTQEMMDFMYDLRELLYEMPFQIPKNLIYLGRCIAILSGMCTGLSPHFNVFSSLVPFGKELINEEIEENGSDLIKKEFTERIKKLVNMPLRVDNLMTKIESGNLSIITQPSQDLEKQFAHLASSVNRLSTILIVVSLVISGTLLYINEQEELGFAGWGLALISLLLSVIKR